MSLSEALRASLGSAIKAYDFPCSTFDFREGVCKNHDSMQGVEAEIRALLLSSEIEDVKNGLSNVLYWGYSRVGYSRSRIRDFRSKVTSDQLSRASQLFVHIQGPAICSISGLGLPQFSGLSFISKLRTFLDPCNYVVLDLKLMELRWLPVDTLFSEVVLRRDATSIRPSRKMEDFYRRWCSLCRKIAHENFDGRDIRPVDIERAIFQLVDSDQAELAARILSAA